MRLISPGIMLLLAAACTSPTAPDLVGEWGGTGAALTLTAGGGSVTYACGAGTVDSAWTLTADGRWTATGQYYAGGGPLPPSGQTPHPARYSGMIRGSRLIFTVTVPDLNQVMGPYTVERGRSGPGVQCL